MNEKQEALDNLMEIARELGSLSYAFYVTGNDKIGDELRSMKNGIINDVTAIKNYDQQERDEQREKANQQIGKVLSAFVNKDEE